MNSNTQGSPCETQQSKVQKQSKHVQLQPTCAHNLPQQVSIVVVRVGRNGNNVPLWSTAQEEKERKKMGTQIIILLFVY